MSGLPKNIETEEEFNKIRIEYHCDYTIDDFIEMFRVSERTMKDLLKGIEHISISKSLYLKMKKEYNDSINRQHFYNRVQVFKELLEKERVIFKFNYMETQLIEGEHFYKHNEVTSELIPPRVVFNHFHYFYDLLETTGTTSDVMKIFEGQKRQLNREVKRMEGIEIIIGKNIKRYMPLMVEVNRLDAIIAHSIMSGIIKEKKIRELNSFTDGS